MTEALNILLALTGAMKDHPIVVVAAAELMIIVLQVRRSERANDRALAREQMLRAEYSTREQSLRADHAEELRKQDRAHEKVLAEANGKLLAEAREQAAASVELTHTVAGVLELKDILLDLIRETQTKASRPVRTRSVVAVVAEAKP